LDEPIFIYPNLIMKNIAQIKAAINETLIKPDKPIIIFRHISKFMFFELEIYKP
jgi:hypothetical protein